MTERGATSGDETARRLRLARDVFSPSVAARERVWTGINTRAALSSPSHLAKTAVTGAAGSRSRGSSGLARAATAAKGGLLIGMGFALGVWFAETRDREASPAPTVASSSEAATGFNTVASSTVASSTERAEAGDTSRPANEDSPTTSSLKTKRTQTASRGSSSVTVRSPTGAGFAEELALLQRAERALRANDGAVARSFVEELEARFPKTVWREERAAILVLAACALDETDAAREAHSFLERHPGSVYFDRIGSLCRLDADGTRRLGH